MAETTGEVLSRSRSRSSDHNERLEPQLLRACENDNVDLLRQIIDSAKTQGQLNDNFLRIALMRSSENGKLNATRYLLERGAPPNGAPGNRLSPLLLAVERHDTLKEKVESLHAQQRVEKRNNIPIVQLLLEHGADPEATDKKGRNALMTATWNNHWHILHMLIQNGANVNARDKKGRNAFMTAAWKNHWHILNVLIQKGVDINARDNRKRNVLHNLAADKAMQWGDSVLELLFEQSISIDGPEGQDELGRTPLHWACATGKVVLAEKLLTRSRGLKANIEAVEIREKTCLHLAAAHDREDMVEMLLRHNANINAKSDGGWTPLHNACEKGREKIVRVLLAAGADINAKLLTGLTPLHLAAQYGHLSVVRCLLERKDIKRAARDTFGSTPFLRAAQNKEKEIVSVLAPFNNLESMSEDALGACNGFNATIVDFGDFRNENRVVKRTVYELLYGRDPMNHRKPAIDILPKEKAVEFRWVHLPANNMAWVEALLSKIFIEEGLSDIEGYKSLEKSFSHQHRGQQSHSHFMRPLCQCSARAPKVTEPETKESSADQVSQNTPLIIIDGPDASATTKIHTTRTPSKASASGDGDRLKSSPQQGGKDQVKGLQKEKGKKTYIKGNKSPKGNETPAKEVSQKHHQYQPKHHKRRSFSSHGRKDAQSSTVPSKGNVFTFMPYLHFESTRRRQEMQEAIKRAETLKIQGRPMLAKAKTYDEMLIRAHLTSSTTSLHVRRTLDQSFYHNIDTAGRDQDQVVYRYQLKGKDLEADDVDPKIVMVDQLWMWILGKDLIVTSFPQRWQQPKNDPLNVLDSVIEDINSKTRDPVNSVYDLATVITNRCSGVFDRHRMGDEEYQFLDMFESSIGSATDRETVLFKEFNAASAQASAWLQQNRRPNRFARFMEYKSLDHAGKAEAKKKNRELKEQNFKFEEFMRSPLFIDNLLDIGQETDLLAETKDIRDELNMIQKVLEDQHQVLPDLEAAICDLYKEEQRSQQDVKKRFREQLKTIEMHIKDIERMDKQAKRIYDSVTDMLDLKQKHANVFEARFARDQAAGTARQTQTIILFTIVTIIFLPLSFIAAFFAIDIREFPHEAGNPALPLSYVSKYTFGIGFAISIPLVAIALNLGDIGDFIREVRRRFILRAQHRRQNALLDDSAEDEGTVGALRIEKALSVARSARKSVETAWIRERLSSSNNRPGSSATESGRERIETRFRMRSSNDIESGVELHHLQR